MFFLPRSKEMQAERESLLESVLPTPTHPRARTRALATCAVAVFFVLTVWMACTESTLDSNLAQISSLPQSWIWGSDVNMGSSDSDSDETVTEQDTQVQDFLADEDEDEDDDGDDDSAEGYTDSQDAHIESKPGYTKYIWHEDLEWDADGTGRLIVVGDVHGMIDALKVFLKELDYRPEQTSRHNDTLVFVGDLVAKYPSVKSSLQTVKYIRSLPAWAVRGNHDQDVLNWRHWMESASMEGIGDKEDKEDDNLEIQDEDEPPASVPSPLKHKWRDEHFKIAKQMSQKSADWLAGRSMTLHIRSLHAYVVHAGLLPWTIPKNKGKKKVHTQNEEGLDDLDQEYFDELDFANEFGITSDTSLRESADEDTFMPVVASPASSNSDSSEVGTSAVSKDLDPEVAILTVPLNREPFTLLEMRGLKKNGKVTKSSKAGQPWAPIWNQVMRGCQQTILEGEEKTDSAFEAEKMKKGQCRPLNVIYGHAAARGLDLNPYSFGLDSGAVYGRSFSALVVEGSKAKRRVLQTSKLESIDVAIAGRHAKVYSMKTDKP